MTSIATAAVSTASVATVVIRADASATIGTGHVVRCLTLAEALKARGLRPLFVCREEHGNLVDRIRERGFDVASLAATTPQMVVENEWPDDLQRQDAEETLSRVHGEAPVWVVVDHYGLGRAWEAVARERSARLLVIDDLANRRHDCDVLLDQNYADRHDRYADLVAPSTRTLLGPDYALLRPEYRAARRAIDAEAGAVRRIFAYFGGSDRLGMTNRVLEALSVEEFAGLDVVVVGPAVGEATVRRAAAARPKTVFLGSRPHLADVMASSDLAVGAGGATTWERLCVGLPAIVVSLAPNQEPSCESLQRAGLIRYLGRAEEVTEVAFRDAVAEWARHPSQIRETSIRGMLLVDGLGAARAAEVLAPSSLDDLTLRRATAGDIDLYFRWVNEAEVRRQSIRTEPISWEDHSRWFRSRLASKDWHLFVLEARGLPLGQIRFAIEEGEACIGYSLDVIARGRGWGRHLVQMGMDELRQTLRVPLRADVKPGNDASSTVFLRLGFVETEPASDGVRTFRKAAE